MANKNDDLDEIIASLMGTGPTDHEDFDAGLDTRTVGSMTVVDVDDLKREMAPIHRLLAELEELRAKYIGMIKAPPPSTESVKNIKSFEELFNHATGHPSYKKPYANAYATEQKLNVVKLNLFAFLQGVKDIPTIVHSEFDPNTIDKYYRIAALRMEEIKARWIIGARQANMSVEEYVNRHVKI